MKKMPSIKAVMTPFPYSVDAGASVADALAFMREHRIRHLLDCGRRIPELGFWRLGLRTRRE